MLMTLVCMLHGICSNSSRLRCHCIKATHSYTHSYAVALRLALDRAGASVRAAAVSHVPATRDLERKFASACGSRPTGLYYYDYYDDYY